MARRVWGAAGALALAVGLAAPAAGAAPTGCGPAWVAAWAASPRAAGPAVTDTSVRHLIRLAAGGPSIRLRLSNLFGAAPLRIGAVTVGLADGDSDTGLQPDRSGSTLAPAVLRGTRKVVRFGGRPDVTLAGGAERWSDPVALAVPAYGGRIVTTVHVVGRSPALTLLASGAHVSSGWQAPGNRAADDAGSAFSGAPGGWSLIRAVDVRSTVRAGVVVAFGDSLTEGYGSTPNADHRYPDLLAARLLVNRGMTAINAGISGNRVVPVQAFPEKQSGGPAALDRFARDALDQSGVTDVLLLEGVNDVIISTPTNKVIAGYRTLVAKAHARGVRVIAGTLPPSGDLTAGDPFGVGSKATETGRAVLNKWIRTSGAFDGVVDFDAAVSDPISPQHWQPGLSTDGLHPNDFGYRLMANTVDLSLFRGAGC